MQSGNSRCAHAKYVLLIVLNNGAIAFLEGPRYAISICVAMAAMDAKSDYSCAKRRSFSAAIALFFA